MHYLAISRNLSNIHIFEATTSAKNALAAVNSATNSHRNHLLHFLSFKPENPTGLEQFSKPEPEINP